MCDIEFLLCVFQSGIEIVGGQSTIIRFKLNAELDQSSGQQFQFCTRLVTSQHAANQRSQNTAFIAIQFEFLE